MKLIEADLLAKTIRNLEIPLDIKKEISENVAKVFFERDPSFDVRRFKTLADISLDTDEINYANKQKEKPNNEKTDRGYSFFPAYKRKI